MINSVKQYRHELSDSIWLFVLQGLNLLVPLFVWPYLMKVIGPEQFGIFGFAQAMANYACLLVDFGFNLSATKRIVIARGNQEELNKIFSSTMIAKLILLLISFLIYILVLCIPKFVVYRSISLLMFLSVIGNMFLLVWLFQGLGKIKIVSAINAFAKVLFFPLIFVLVKSPSDTWIAVVIYCATYLAAAVSIVCVGKKQNLATFVRVSKHDVIGEMKISWPIFLSQAATSIYTMLFVVILAYYVSPKEVGWYTAAEKIIRVMVATVLIPITGAFYPKVSELSVNQRNKAHKFIKTLAALFVVVFIVGGILLCIFAEFIVDWLGDKYDGMQLLIYMLAFVPIPITLGSIFGQFGLVALGDNYTIKVYSRIYYVAALIALLGVFLLSRFYGVIGTAIALIITEVFVCLSMIIAYYQLIPKTIKNE